MKTDTLTIRAAASDDAYRLAWFAATTFMATYAGLVPDEYLLDYVAGAFSTDTTRVMIADADTSVFLAEVDGSLAGYAVVRSTLAPAPVEGRHPLELGRLYVDANLHGQGIGSKLLAVVDEHALDNGNDTLWLTVWEHNNRAIPVYERWGFERVGAIQFDFAGDMHADYVMARRLAP